MVIKFSEVSKFFGIGVLAIFAIFSLGNAQAQDISGEADLGQVVGESDEKLLGVLTSLLADPFEPDNTPSLAVWSGLQKVVSGVTGLLLNPDMHNLHVTNDEDWSKFEAVNGDKVRVETMKVGAGADTFLTVYRVLPAGQPLPTVVGPCGAAWVQGPDGQVLVPLACNDDSGETGAQGIRSLINFTAPQAGLYYARVTLSEKAKGAKSTSEDTSYGFAASSASTMSTTLFCTVKKYNTSTTVTNATLTIKENGAKVTKNSKGVYTISGLRSGATYTLQTAASGYFTKTASVRMGSGSSSSYTQQMTSNNTKEDVISVTEQTAAAFDFAAPFGQITLEEVLRVVQLHNAGGYHCDEASEDSFAPLGGGLQCAPHPLDSINQDWNIDMSELLRAIQFFNLGGYHNCEESPDGLCAGLN